MLIPNLSEPGMVLQSSPKFRQGGWMWTALKGEAILVTATWSAKAIPNSQSIPSNWETKSLGPKGD